MMKTQPGMITMFGEISEEDISFDESNTIATVSINENEDGFVSDEGMFVMIQSVDSEKFHLPLKHFLGQRVKVTIEVID